ncbi:histidine phosphatase family protein [Paenibacillus azoreducens]|nr:histidine phosphatase family protein [Paenibacillus azoreducens]
MVRHAESRYIQGAEMTRELSEQGKEDALQVSRILRNEAIEFFYSSPYRRAVQTIEPTAREAEKDISIIWDLRERTLAGDGFQMPEGQFFNCKRQLYDDFNFALPGGESSFEAQRRGVEAILGLLERDLGKRIAIGTHGDIMTLIMNYFDPKYDYEFWRSTMMPDVYKLVFEDGNLTEVTRCWTVKEAG